MNFGLPCTEWAIHTHWSPTKGLPPLQILAAAELLSDTTMSHPQMSFLQTIQACGTSLVETVNHVLDFTKLSGNTRSGGVENSMHRTKSVSVFGCTELLLMVAYG
jgi:signal transduction histidine kinase